MCSLSSMTSRKFMERQLFFYLVFLLTVAVLSSASESRPKALTFVSWGERCKIPKKGENLKPHERCDESRGIVCQQYRQGEYCGCRVEVASAETVSYDRKSKECRLKVGQYCHYINATAYPDDFARLPFNAKCHENAECKYIRLITKQENLKKSEDTTCVCKEGFIASSDLSECNNPNFASSATANKVLCGLALLIVSIRYKIL